MKSSVCKKKQNLKGARWWLLIAVLSILSVAVIVPILDISWQAPGLQKNLLVGLLAASLAALSFLLFLEYQLGKFAQPRGHEPQAGAEIVWHDTQGRYQMMFDNNVDAMLVWRVDDGCITGVNAAFCKVTGYRKEQVIDSSVLALAALYDSSEQERLSALFAQQGYIENEAAYIHLRDGSRILAAASAVTLMLHGKPHVVAKIRDISALKEAELRLQQSEALLRSTLALSDEGILMLATDGQVLSANARFMALWQIPPSLVEAKENELLIAYMQEQLRGPEDFLALLQRRDLSEEVVRDTLNFKDGRVYTCYIRAMNVGEERGSIWCFKDTTEQAKANARLEEREEIFRSIVTQANDGILMLDVETQRFIEFNDAACQMAGYSRAEFSALTWSDLQLALDTSEGRDRLLSSVEQRVSVFESQHRAKDGHDYAVRVSNRAIRLHERDYIIVIITDISERKLIEAAQRIAAIAFESQEGMMITDANQRIIKVNRAFTEITGYSSEEVLGNTPNMLSSGCHETDFYQSIWKTIAQVGAWEGEIWNKRKNGQIYPEHLMITAVTDAQGQITHYVGTLTDSTEREEAWSQLRKAAEALAQANAQIEEERALLAERVEERTQQLQHANKAKDAFLATMSHEIRTPLGGMLGMMDLLGRSGLEGKQKEMFQVAQNSGKNLLHIVDDILDWSKMEAGRLVLEPQITSLEEVLKYVVASYRHLAEAKDIHLHYVFDARIAAAHLLDPMRVAQILSNFTSNAIKFTLHGTIELGATWLARQEESEVVRLTVKDTGVGIAQSQQEQLFRQYEQGSTDTARMYGGTGLGLGICRRLAEMMEGVLGVDSEMGKGSSFHLTCRLAVANSPAQLAQRTRMAEQPDQGHEPDKLPLRADGKPATILIADDHPVNRMLLKQQLQLLGLQVESASSGIPALAVWRDGHFDLLITDCHMPEMDGYELTRNIRNIERLESRSRMPVLAWTANVLSDEHQRCAEAGMDAVLTKPTELSELSAKLSHWLEKSSNFLVEMKHKDGGAEGVVIDMAVLAKIAKRAVSQVAMLREFDVHNGRDVAILLAALKAGDPAAVVRSAHRVKGASYMVGALELAELCSLIERAVTQGEMDGARRVAESALPLALKRLDEFIAKFVAD